MAYVIQQSRRTCCTCANPAAQVTPGAALRAAGFFRAFPALQQELPTTTPVIQPRVPDPFYNGPCGTRESVPGCCQTNDFYPTYGYFTQTGGLTLAAGGSIPFSGPCHQSPTGVQYENGQVVLSQPGTYRVSYMVHLPADVAVDTTFALVVGGLPVPGTVLAVVKDADSGTQVVTAHALITTDVSSILQVTSSSALTFTGLDTAATLTFHRIA